MKDRVFKKAFYDWEKLIVLVESEVKHALALLREESGIPVTNYVRSQLNPIVELAQHNQGATLKTLIHYHKISSYLSNAKTTKDDLMFFLLRRADEFVRYVDKEKYLEPYEGYLTRLGKPVPHSEVSHD